MIRMEELMIKHIVIWKLKESDGESVKAANAKKLKTDIEALKEEIPEIKNIEVGLNMSASDQSGDVVLYSEFNSLADLEIYQNHPAHQKVVEFVKEVVSERRVVDYDVKQG